MEQLVYKIPETIKEDFQITFCAGCDHGIAARLIAEVIDELGVREKTIAIASVGCSVFPYDYFNLDIIEAQHGRSMAAASGLKRAKPDKIVFTYQGDGDLASIGIAETIHAMARGEKITAVCINNTTYGMTGGQAGPTTLLGQVTATTALGRNPEIHGYPLKISELLKEIDGAAYIARVTLDNPSAVRNAKKCIKKAFEAQIKGIGTGFVEILASCPTNWKMTPKEAHERVRGEMSEIFKPGVYKDKVTEVL